MKIMLNGQWIETKARDMAELRCEVYAAESMEESQQQRCIWIVDGFQTEENLPLREEMTVNCIEKGCMPDRTAMESMLCARHTPHVYEKVKQAHVAIAGLGGLGSNIAVMLARTGVGHLHLIDFDIVEPSNLNRQQYLICHLGMYKTEAMKAMLAQMNPYVQVDIDTVRIDENNCAELLKDDDIICEAFDRADTKAMLTEQVLCHYPEKILICGSGMAGYGPSGTIITRKITDHFYLCGDGVSAAEPGNGLMAPRVTICAAHQANMALRSILGLEDT
ncbi:MAG: sulfur carrier protein ThiS adenylyltransferase ThiF [Clostridiales bacterium]|nr:sulfur carrier protein ThiS adenylyltransferase ThiF [Clostridiales bacterium]